jgi:protein-disulfide isomerase
MTLKNKKILIILFIVICAIYFTLKNNIFVRTSSQQVENKAEQIKPKIIPAEKFVSKESVKIETKKIIDSNLLEELNFDIIFGNLQAPITIVEYSSFNCFYCVKMHNEVMNKLKREYIDTNRVKFIHRAIVNKKTIFGKMLQHCVDKKNLYKLTSDLFNTNKEWAYSENILEQLQLLALKYEMDEKDFRRCIYDNKLGQSIIDRQNRDVKILAINSTPVLFINGERIAGSRSYKEIKDIINKFLEKNDK